MDLPILYEDADVVAVNKPAGFVTHGESASGPDLKATEWQVIY